MLQYTGKVVKKSDVQIVSEKFKKAEFVVTDGAASYPQFIAFQLTQKNTDLLNDFNVGDEVEVTFGLKGREYNGKYFTNLDAFRVKRLAGNKQATPFEPQDDQSLPF